MEIRLATREDYGKINRIYSYAREFMKAAGNPFQWKDGYPCEEIILSDIDLERLYLVLDNGEPVAVFVYFFGEEPDYKKIYDGEWKNGEPYGVIHRIAVAENSHGKGISRLCFDFAFGKCGNVRIDTHKENHPMQKALSKCGFEYCGKIYLKNGEERFAYQKITK